jgi:hypothetical protein
MGVVANRVRVRATRRTSGGTLRIQRNGGRWGVERGRSGWLDDLRVQRTSFSKMPANVGRIATFGHIRNKYSATRRAPPPGPVPATKYCVRRVSLLIKTPSPGARIDGGALPNCFVFMAEFGRDRGGCRSLHGRIGESQVIWQGARHESAAPTWASPANCNSAFNRAASGSHTRELANMRQITT